MFLNDSKLVKHRYPCCSLRSQCNARNLMHSHAEVLVYKVIVKNFATGISFSPSFSTIWNIASCIITVEIKDIADESVFQNQNDFWWFVKSSCKSLHSKSVILITPITIQNIFGDRCLINNLEHFWRSLKFIHQK